MHGSLSSDQNAQSETHYVFWPKLVLKRGVQYTVFCKWYQNKRYDETDNGYGFRDIELGYIHCRRVSPGCFVGHDILGTQYNRNNEQVLSLLSSATFRSWKGKWRPQRESAQPRDSISAKLDLEQETSLSHFYRHTVLGRQRMGKFIVRFHYREMQEWKMESTTRISMVKQIAYELAQILV